MTAGTREVSLDGALARRWMDYAVDGLEQARETLDALNVFPVPDGDTGTNLVLTLRRAAREVDSLPADAPVGEVLAAIATGALMGARGNSGIITSQLLLGWAQAWNSAPVADARMLARALTRADEQAWTAVATPLEGTILSVTRAAARAAQQAAARDAQIPEVLTRVAEAARQALSRTTSQLRELDEAGVVDAGGAGVVVLLDALEAAALGTGPHQSLSGLELGHPRTDCFAHDPAGPAFEVMYLLTTEDDRAPTLRRTLAEIGDSVVVVGGSGLWHVHVHTDDVNAAVEAGSVLGTPHRTRVTHLASGDPHQIALAAAGRGQDTEVAVIACATGPGLAAVFARAGFIPVQAPGGLRASTEELLEAIHEAGARNVLLLPNDPDTVRVAEAAAARAADLGVEVTVVPTTSQVQALAAAAVLDPEVGPAHSLAQVTEAVAHVRDGAVARAARAAQTQAGPCTPGQVLGLIGGEVALLGEDVTDVTLRLLDLLLTDSGDLVTLVTGADAPPALVPAVRQALAGRPVDLDLVDGGQKVYPVLLGVE